MESNCSHWISASGQTSVNSPVRPLGTPTGKYGVHFHSKVDFPVRLSPHHGQSMMFSSSHLGRAGQPSITRTSVLACSCFSIEKLSVGFRAFFGSSGVTTSCGNGKKRIKICISPPQDVGLPSAARPGHLLGLVPRCDQFLPGSELWAGVIPWRSCSLQRNRYDLYDPPSGFLHVSLHGTFLSQSCPWTVQATVWSRGQHLHHPSDDLGRLSSGPLETTWVKSCTRYEAKDEDQAGCAAVIQPMRCYPGLDRASSAIRSGHRMPTDCTGHPGYRYRYRPAPCYITQNREQSTPHVGKSYHLDGLHVVETMEVRICFHRAHDYSLFIRQNPTCPSSTV